MKNEKILKRLKGVLSLLIIFLLISALEWWGLLGLLIFLLAFLLKRIWDGRESIRLAIWNAETSIWGKPLNREFWNKGEFKDKRVRFVWKKKKI